VTDHSSPDIDQCRLPKIFGKKRDVEDRSVEYLLTPDAPNGFREAVAELTTQLEAVQWGASRQRRRICSCANACSSASTQFGSRFRAELSEAELDIHFSLSSDVTPLWDFLHIYKESGLPRLAAYLSRGKI
jgi:hypothetical protein